MANPIDLIITKEAINAIDIAIAKVNTLDEKLQNTAQHFIDNSRKMASASGNITPSVVNDKGNDTAKLSADLDKLKAKYVSLNDAIQKKLEQTRLSEIRLQQQREKAFDSFDKNAKKEEAALKKQETAYQRIQNSVNILTKTYQDLAIRKELGGTLTSKEEKQLESLTKRINTYQTALKNTDSIIQKNGRNVGNYANQYNGLGNSINQLTREAPAAAVSMNTFFLAISNNLPIFFDEIGKLRQANIELAKSGEPVKSVLKQVIGAFVSWGTVLSLGVTLLTLYGGKIIEWVGSLIKTETVLSATARAQQSLNKAFSDAAKNTSSEITHLQLLASTAEDLSLPMEARKRAVKEMQELYPHYLGNLSQEAILTGQASDEMALLTKNIIAAAVARGIEEEISKKANADYKERRLLVGEINNDIAELDKTQSRVLGRLYSQNQKDAYKIQAKQEKADYIKLSQDKVKAFDEQKQKENQLLIAAYKFQVELSGKLGPDGKDESDKKATKVKKERREDIEGLENHLKTVGTLKDEIDAEISRLTTERITGGEDALPAVNFQLEMLIKLRKQLAGLPEADIKIINTVKKTTAAVKELSEETKKFLKSFVDEFASKSGFSSLISSFDLDNKNSLFSKIKEGIAFTKENWQASTVEIAEAGQEMYNFIANASQANFDSEKERLQNQYDVAIKYAGDNKAAQEKLADDLEKQKKDIANREAKAKKQQAIFNIAIDTAQAIVAALPNYVLAGIIAVLGAAQIAFVSSQKIPQYWMGGKHEGGLMMVNDGSGPNYKETIVTPDGKVMKPQGKNVVMNAPAGTEIYTKDQWDTKLSEMLQGKGIEMAPAQNTYSGISKSDMRDAMLEAIGEQPQYHSNFDGNGATNYIIKKGNITRLANNRGNSIKLRF